MSDELNHESSSPPLDSALRRPWVLCIHTLPNQRPSATTCQSHLLTGNWVFIRSPARGRCSFYLTQLSGKMGDHSVLLFQDTPGFFWFRCSGSEHAGIFQTNHRSYFIWHLPANMLIIIKCKLSNCANARHNSSALLWPRRNERWWKHTLQQWAPRGWDLTDSLFRGSSNSENKNCI